MTPGDSTDFGKDDSWEFVEHLFRNLPGAFYLFDEDGKLVRWNQQLMQLSGYTDAELRGASYLMFFDGDDKEAAREKIREVIAKGAAALEATFVTKDGRRISVYFNGNRIEINGKPYVAGVGLDITKRVRAEKAYRESEARYRAIVEDQTELIVRCLPDGTRTFVNDAYCRYFGKTRKELLGTSFFDHVAKDHRQARQRKLDALSPKHPVAVDEHASTLPDGSTRWQEWVDRGIFDKDGRLVEIQAVGRDVSRIHELSDKLRKDALTGLVNREEFARCLGRLVERAREDRTEHAVLALDVIQLRVVNTACGYAGGDGLLRKIAEILTETARGGDTLGRISGDEFAVLMERCTLTQAWRLANALRERMETFEFRWGEQSFTIDLAMGLVGVDETSGTPDEVLRSAAGACAQARESGEDVYVAGPGDAHEIQRSTESAWVSRIERALRGGSFQLVAQRIAPLFSSGAEGKHYELLVRMIDDRGEFVSPGLFLPVAERYRLSPRIDRWVIDTALSRMAAHASVLEGVDVISINLSGTSLDDMENCRYVIDRLEETGVPATKVCFEITETAAMANLENARVFLDRLRKCGCRISLDDFGAGFSSFAYLKNLPVDYLKIDGMFIKSIVDDAIDFAMVKSINDIGHAMGKRTIAEFVENDAIVEKLREIGVDYAQGYGIAKPEPFEDVLS